MTNSFVDYLNEINPNDESIEIATKAFIAEYYNDILPEEMKTEMMAFIEDENSFGSIISELESSPSARRDACVNLLSWAWTDPDKCEKIKGAFEGSLSKLPVIELSILALVAMYAMNLIVTGGVKRVEKSIVKNEQGRYEEKNTIEYHDPIGPMALVPKLFSIFSKGKSEEK